MINANLEYLRQAALIVVDVQEDFFPENGSLAIQNGRDIIPTINKLLDLPFVLKIASKDMHPKNHVSFTTSHERQKNVPFSNMCTISNPENSSQKKQIRLWPPHCVVGTPGAEFVSELDILKLDIVTEKATKENIEMYSVFYDIWGKDSSGISKTLKEKGITDVWVVGLAFDYCVKETAIDAVEEGFNTTVLREATKASSTKNWDQTEHDLRKHGVKVVSIDDILII